jgi:hypothetical protein
MCINDEDCDCHLIDEDDDFDLNALDEELIDGVGFAYPGGESALRAATEDNPRNRPCPTCGEENRLTRLDEMHHYQCDCCAEKEELGF